MSTAAESRAKALRRLPSTYCLALRLRDAGLSDELIAERLQIEPAALPLLFVVGEVKLAEILGEAQSPKSVDPE